MGLGFSLMGFPAMSQAATEMDSTALSDAAEPGAVPSKEYQLALHSSKLLLSLYRY
jgi:hypothetical protein